MGGKLELHVPELNELWYRQQIMADPDTMSYNAGYDEFEGYNKKTGCIEFPEQEWEDWHRYFVGQEPERYYAYIVRKEDGAFIGEVNLHKSVEQDWHEMGIVLDAKYRGMGYSVEALKLLVEYGFEKMQVSAIHNIFEVEREAAIQTHLSAGFQVHSKQGGMIELLITKDTDYQTYWETCWQEEDAAQLQLYLEGWENYHGREIELFKANQVKSVCDAACGFGAYSIAFAVNGFEVSAFDISPASVEITRQGLAQCGFKTVEIKVASILDTGYEAAVFDAVNAHAVLDHLTVADAKRAIGELLRITRKGGLVVIFFDGTEEEDFTEEHVEIELGTMQYVSGSRKGMLFHPYEWEEIERLLEKYEILDKWSSRRGEKVVVLRK